MAFWLLAAGIGLAVTLALGWTRIAAAAPPDTRLVLLALTLPLIVFLYEALPEELIFRGYVYRNLVDRYPRWLAVTGQATLFTLWGTAVGAAGSVDRVILFLTFSIVLGILRVVTGTLWAGIGFHVAFQWVTQLLAAAMNAGVVQVDDFGTLQVVVFWLFPIVLGSVTIVVWSVRGRRASWRARDPDPSGNDAPGFPAFSPAGHE